MSLSEKLLTTLGAFLFGYCLGYYSFELFKYKNKKEEIHEFFSSYSKKNGSKYQSNSRKLEEIKVDLSYERKFLDETTEKLGADLKTVKFQLIWVKNRCQFASRPLL